MRACMSVSFACRMLGGGGARADTCVLLKQGASRTTNGSTVLHLNDAGLSALPGLRACRCHGQLVLLKRSVGHERSPGRAVCDSQSV
jgi:hypothetical protein